MVRYAPISRDRHARTRVLPAINRGYAAGVAVVPVISDELGIVAAYYPLAFARLVDQGPPVMVAVMGLTPSRNLFVDAAGDWRGGYIPALLRRYPFMLAPGQQEGAFVVCIDEESGLLTEAGGETLFGEDGGQSSYLTQVGEFLAAIQSQAGRMETIGRQLEEAGVLTGFAVRSRADLPGPDAALQAGLMRIDEGALNTLDDAAFLGLRKSGALTIAYAQLATTGQWERLSMVAKLAGVRPATPAAAAPAPSDSDWVLSFD